jgi:hypothetical protein
MSVAEISGAQIGLVGAVRQRLRRTEACAHSGGYRVPCDRGAVTVGNQVPIWRSRNPAPQPHQLTERGFTHGTGDLRRHVPSTEPAS